MSNINNSFLSYFKGIKIPVFRFFLYSGIGYLGYIFYQDYKYKQLLAQIHESNSKSSSSSKQTPLSKITNIIKSISSCESKYQLRFLYKDLQLHIQKYWIDPYMRNNLIDFKVKQLNKPDNQKYIWWLKHYYQKYYYWTNYYHRKSIQKQGTFGLFFWLDTTIRQNYQVLECNKIQQLIDKALKLRGQKCIKFAFQQNKNQSNNYNLSKNDQYLIECMKQTQKSSAYLQKIKDRLNIIQSYQNR